MKKRWFKAFIALFVVFASLLIQGYYPVKVLGNEILVDNTTSKNQPFLLNLDVSTTAIYLNGVNGDDSNNGGTKETAVKTFERAKEIACAYQNINTIYITGRVKISGEISLDGTNAIIKRDSSFNGYLFWVAFKDAATLSDITVDGNFPEAAGASCALINCEGNLTITDGTILQNNKIASKTVRRTNGGGAIYGNRSGCVINMTGGIIQDNTAMWGGGIYLTGNAVLNMSGGIIRNNQVFNGPGMESYWNNASAGGGVCLYEGATFNMSGNALIQNNFSQEVGGGVSIGTLEASVYCDNIFNMTGGTIDGNTSGASGGGIFVQAAYTAVKKLKSEAHISSGYITNNKMDNSGVTNSMFGGGGIYVNGFRHEDFKNGELFVTNAVITENIAEKQGGGYAACPITNTKIYMKEGCALYNNEAQSAKDIFFYSATIGFGFHGGNPVYSISNTMLGGEPYNWKYNDGTEIPLNKLNGVLSGEGASLSLQAGNVGNDNTQMLAKVFITGNYSATRGGGIGSNGNVTIGVEDEVIKLDVTKLWDDNEDEKKIRPQNIEVELWRKLMGSDEDPVYIGYEVIEPDENNSWMLRFNRLLQQDELGNDYEYIIRERKIPEYVTEISGDMVNGFEITNSIGPETITITGKKTWLDRDNVDGRRPASITIRLYKNNVEIKSLTVTAADDWSWVFEDLPKYENDQLIVYTVGEDLVLGYSCEIDGYDIINTYMHFDYHEIPPTDGEIGGPSGGGGGFEVPKTGDNFNLLFWINVMMISFVSVNGVLVYQYKKRK